LRFLRSRGKESVDVGEHQEFPGAYEVGVKRTQERKTTTNLTVKWLGERRTVP